MTPKLRKIINDSIPRGGRIGKGWYEDFALGCQLCSSTNNPMMHDCSSYNRMKDTDEIGELAIPMLKDKINSIFEIATKNRRDTNAIKER